MRIKLLTVGKTSYSFIDEGSRLYMDRLKRYCKFEFEDLIISKNPKDPAALKKLEGEKILKRIGSSDWLVLLDEKGKLYSSRQFATELEKQGNVPGRTIVFLIGGAYGFSEEVYKRANAQVSLSRMTFSHQIVRLIALEQIYRAFTIMRGEPYHND